jgi:tetratricopeptide (TPR) repeat protein
VDELDPYEAALDAAIVVYEKAHGAHTLTTKALEAVAANKAIADANYEAVKATYKTDVEEATANIYETIDAAINHAEFMETVIKLMAMGDKFTEMYDDEVVTTVENAVFAGLFADTQEEIDAQVEIINSYVDALDWSTFNHWVGIIRSFDSDDYTIFTWAEFVEAINAIASPDTYETQDDIDAAVESIKAALDILKDDIYQAEEMQKYLDETLIEREWIAENYTPKSWAPFYAEVIKPFQDAITALAECTDGSQFNALEAEVIRLYNLFDEDYTDITTYTELVWIKEINELLAKADEVTDDVVEDGEPEYSDITKLYLLAVLPEAKKAYNLAIDLDTANTDAQDYVAKATEILKPVVEALADVTALKAAIAEYEAAVEGIVYTVESWNDYQIALATAEFVVVTAKTTAEADEALAALTAAYEALVEYVAIDLEDLDEAIAAAEGLNKADYTSDSWDKVRDTLGGGKIEA